MRQDMVSILSLVNPPPFIRDDNLLMLTNTVYLFAGDQVSDTVGTFF